jgi:hypothetical protein
MEIEEGEVRNLEAATVVIPAETVVEVPGVGHVVEVEPERQIPEIMADPQAQLIIDAEIEHEIQNYWAF